LEINLNIEMRILKIASIIYLLINLNFWGEKRMKNFIEVRVLKFPNNEWMNKT